VVDLVDALKKGIASEAAAPKVRAPAGQKEMLLPLEGNCGTEKKAAKSERSTASCKAW
jgi:hypothetical protein